MALYRRMFQLGSTSAIHFSKHHHHLRGGSSFSLANKFLQSREISQLVHSPNGKRACFVDTLALVRSLEKQDVPTKQAEAITDSITEVLDHTLVNISQSFATKAELQKSEMTQDANLSKFKSEIKNQQEHHFSLLQREVEKLRGEVDKIRSELRYEVDKLTAGQRLDLNLERGRTRDELANQSAETTSLTNKLDREIHTLRAQLEAAKYDVIKYCIGTLVSVAAAGLALIRIMIWVPKFLERTLAFSHAVFLSIKMTTRISVRKYRSMNICTNTTINYSFVKLHVLS